MDNTIWFDLIWFLQEQIPFRDHFVLNNTNLVFDFFFFGNNKEDKIFLLSSRLAAGLKDRSVFHDVTKLKMAVSSVGSEILFAKKKIQGEFDLDWFHSGSDGQNCGFVTKYCNTVKSFSCNVLPMEKTRTWIRKLLLRYPELKLA